MSPLSLRRYRAERLLRHEFDGLRDRVLTRLRSRLGGQEMRLDALDLDGAYAQAWQGLYTAILSGETIDSPIDWLVVVAYRRVVDEHRYREVRSRAVLALVGNQGGSHELELPDGDIEERLDDQGRLRQLFEGLRGRLSPRECEAASLCYLQGLSRSEAAARMGLSEPRMHKLMDGRGRARPGVAAKVGGLLETIRGGDWCEQQASSMRGLAFGILDPAGERYRLALLHSRECPACRTYVLSLRGLAAVLPPVALPWGLGLGAIVGGAGSAAGSAGVAGSAGSGAGLAAGGAGAGAAGGASGASVGVAAAGVGGAAGGGWLLVGGSVTAKLAVTCLLVLGVGCVALSTDLDRHGHAGSRKHPATRTHPAATTASSSGSAHDAGPATRVASSGGAGSGSATHKAPHRLTASDSSSTKRSAAREFGPEQAVTSTASTHASTPAPAQASTASAPTSGPEARSASASSGATRGAAREFGPG